MFWCDDVGRSGVFLPGIPIKTDYTRTCRRRLVTRVRDSSKNVDVAFACDRIDINDDISNDTPKDVFLINNFRGATAEAAGPLVGVRARSVYVVDPGKNSFRFP